MKIIGDTQIVRTVPLSEDMGGIAEWEIPVAFNVEELYKGSEEPDDPSTCTINERVKVLEDTGPFKVGDMLVLTGEEQREIEQEELQNQL
jgi:hypothetical protein